MLLSMMVLTLMRPYAPELNPLEHLWDELRVKSSVAWDWIINALLN